MENENGIAVGIETKRGNSSTTNWYAAHSLARRRNGSFVIYARDEKRTAYGVPARLFAGVYPGIRETFSGKLLPDISEYREVVS